jgi:acyl dehydratase
VDQPTRRAAAGPFGSTVAHGFLTLSLSGLFIEQLLRVEGAGMILNYGLDRARFPSVVPVNSRLRGGGVLAAAHAVPSPGSPNSPSSERDTKTRLRGADDARFYPA